MSSTDIIKSLETSFEKVLINIKIKGNEKVYHFCPICHKVYAKSASNRGGHIEYIHSGLSEEQKKKWRLLLIKNNSSWFYYGLCLVIEYILQDKKNSSSKRESLGEGFEFAEVPWILKGNIEEDSCKQSLIRLYEREYGTYDVTEMEEEEVLGDYGDLNRDIADYITNAVRENEDIEKVVSNILNGTNKVDLNKKINTVTSSSMEEVNEYSNNEEELILLPDNDITMEEEEEEIEEELFNTVFDTNEQENNVMYDEEEEIEEELRNGNMNEEEVETMNEISSYVNDVNDENATIGEEDDDELRKEEDIVNQTNREEEKLKELLNTYDTAKEMSRVINKDDCNIEICADKIKESGNIMLMFELICMCLMLAFSMTKKECKTIIKMMHLLICLFVKKEERPTLHLSYSKILRRIKIVNKLKEEGMKENMKKCKCYSLAVDDTSKKGTTKMGMYARMKMADNSIKQEKLALSTFTPSTTGKNIFGWIFDTIKAIGSSLTKCIGITTDGASNMRGKFKGLGNAIFTGVTKLRNKYNVCKDFFIEKFYCLCHRLNLCVGTMCMSEDFRKSRYFISWLIKSTTMSSWNKYIHEKGLKSIPKPSNTRWVYTYNIVKFIRNNYEHIKLFMEENDGKYMKEFIEYCHSRMISEKKITQETIDNFSFIMDDRFKGQLMIFDLILKESSILSSRLQPFFATTSEDYKLILDHIKWVYDVKDVVNGDKTKMEQLKNEDLKEFYHYCNSKELQLDDTFKRVLDLYLKALITRYINFNGDKDTTDYNLETYEAFINKFKTVNQNNKLYQAAHLQNNFKTLAVAPECLPEVVKAEYTMLRINPAFVTLKEKCSLVELLRTLNDSRYEHLLDYLMMTNCIMPTSCSVESLFSYMKNAYHLNAKDSTNDARLDMALNVKGLDAN